MKMPVTVQKRNDLRNLKEILSTVSPNSLVKTETAVSVSRERCPSYIFKDVECAHYIGGTHTIETNPHHASMLYFYPEKEHSIYPLSPIE
jgi:hypothetical protein